MAPSTPLAACQPKVVEVEKVTQIVKEEVIVEGTPKIVEKVVEKVVEVAAPAEKAVDALHVVGLSSAPSTCSSTCSKTWRPTSR